MTTFKTSLVLAVTLFSTLCFTIPGDWYVHKGAGYTVEFPKKPTENDQEVPTAIGNLTMKMNMLDMSGQEDENLVYGCISTVYPADKIHSDSTALLETFFRNSVDGAVANLGGGLLSEEKISLKGYPGRDIKVDFQNGRAVIRMQSYLVKNNMYILQVITPPDNSENLSAVRFLASFKLTD